MKMVGCGCGGMTKIVLEFEYTSSLRQQLLSLIAQSQISLAFCNIYNHVT